MGLHGTWALIVTLGLASVTLIAVIKTGLIPLFQGLARIVEAVEVILGTEKTVGLEKRLDQADAERERAATSIEGIQRVLSGASLLNGKGELLVKNVDSLISNQQEIRQILAEHIRDEATRSAKIWQAIAESRGKS